MKKMSIIYLAYNTNDAIQNIRTGGIALRIKIGQTANSDVRASQLKKKGEYLDRYAEVPNNAAVRQYIESYIRLKITNFVPNVHNGYDHFTIDQHDYKSIADNFGGWVYEAVKGIQQNTLYNKT